MWSHKTRIFVQMRVQVHSNDPMCRVVGIWSVPRTARMMAIRTIREATPVGVVDIKKIYINPLSIQLQCYVPFDVPSDPPSLITKATQARARKHLDMPKYTRFEHLPTRFGYSNLRRVVLTEPRVSRAHHTPKP